MKDLGLGFKPWRVRDVKVFRTQGVEGSRLGLCQSSEMVIATPSLSLMAPIRSMNLKLPSSFQLEPSDSVVPEHPKNLQQFHFRNGVMCLVRRIIKLWASTVWTCRILTNWAAATSSSYCGYKNNPCNFLSFCQFYQVCFHYQKKLGHILWFHSCETGKVLGMHKVTLSFTPYPLCFRPLSSLSLVYAK